MLKTKSRVYYYGNIEELHYYTGVAAKLTEHEHQELLKRSHTFPTTDGNWLLEFDDPGFDDLLCHEDELEFI